MLQTALTPRPLFPRNQTTTGPADLPAHRRITARSKGLSVSARCAAIGPSQSPPLHQSSSAAKSFLVAGSLRRCPPTRPAAMRHGQSPAQPTGRPKSCARATPAEGAGWSLPVEWPMFVPNWTGWQPPRRHYCPAEGLNSGHWVAATPNLRTRGRGKLPGRSPAQRQHGFWLLDIPMGMKRFIGRTMASHMT